MICLCEGPTCGPKETLPPSLSHNQKFLTFRENPNPPQYPLQWQKPLRTSPTLEPTSPRGTKHSHNLKGLTSRGREYSILPQGLLSLEACPRVPGPPKTLCPLKSPTVLGWPPPYTNANLPPSGANACVCLKEWAEVHGDQVLRLLGPQQTQTFPLWCLPDIRL